MKFWKSREWKSIQEILIHDKGHIQPSPAYVFRPLIETPLHKVKVMILGREPPSMMEVDGLAYSHPRPITSTTVLPMALQNIFEELQNDLGIDEPRTGSLVRWAQKGVLLWNATLTVKKGFPFSHVGIGWHHLTQEVVETAYLANPNCVFVPWGDNTDIYLRPLPKGALILPGPGPGVASFSNGWWKSKPFSRINELLKETGQTPIPWYLN